MVKNERLSIAASSSADANTDHTTEDRQRTKPQEQQENEEKFLQDLEDQNFLQGLEDQMKSDVKALNNTSLEKLKTVPKGDIFHIATASLLLNSLGQRVLHPCKYIDTTESECNKSPDHREVVTPNPPEEKFWGQGSNLPDLRISPDDAENFYPNNHVLSDLFGTRVQINGEAHMVQKMELYWKTKVAGWDPALVWTKADVKNEPNRR